MAIIYAPTGETFQGGVNNVFFNGVRQCHVGTDYYGYYGCAMIAYDCNTACVSIWNLSSQINDWALETCWAPGYCQCCVRMRYRWCVAPSGGITLCDCWQGGPWSHTMVVYETKSYFRPNSCFCACIYGYGCSPRHFTTSAPFGNCNFTTCIYIGDCYSNIYFECGWACAYTDWQIMSSWEYDCLANVGFRPQIDIYSYPSYGVTTCIQGMNPGGTYYCCGPVGERGTIVLDH